MSTAGGFLPPAVPLVPLFCLRLYVYVYTWYHEVWRITRVRTKMMPNKTIYVADADVSLFDRAQELGGGNLSAAIVEALRRYVANEELVESGEVVVKVGAHGAYRQQRFQGRQVGRYHASRSDQARALFYRVYLTNKGNFAVYLRDMPNWGGRRPPGYVPGKSEGAMWEQYAGDWWSPASRLEVYPSLAELEAHLPPELFSAVRSSVEGNGIEDLDI
jgi:EXLDI family protein